MAMMVTIIKMMMIMIMVMMQLSKSQARNPLVKSGDTCNDGADDDADDFNDDSYSSTKPEILRARELMIT